MRAIFKREANHLLARRHQTPPATSEEARRSWKNFRGQRKKATQNRCLHDEQYSLCAYSEIPLVDGTGRNQGLGAHLDHIEPRSTNPNRTFDHTNLIVSAIDDEALGQLARHDVFGGHARLEWWNPDAFIHPLRPNCARYFHYEASSGRVVPNTNMPRRDRAKARLTIYKLNLNAAILVNWRRTWLAQKAELIETFLDQPEILKQLARQELLPHEGILKPFHSAVSQLFGSIAEEILVEMG